MKMDVISLRTVLILAILAVLLGYSDAWGRRRRRRRCASHSCTWHWGSCSRTCGGGTQSPIKTGSQGACGSCNMPSSSRSCNAQCCPVNCQWRVWSSWGSCTRNCGRGTQSRSRVKNAERCGGRACSGSVVETRACNQNCCPVHCAWASWSSWGSCSQTCGGGAQSRNRGYSSTASCGGNSCPGSSVETRSCNQNCCPVNCVWNAWSNWGGCSRSCGGGTQARKRGYSVASSCGGTACSGNSNEQRSCNRQCCPVNCVWGLWSGWGVCSVSCGGGSQSRNRGQSTAMSCGGTPCSGGSADSRACNNHCCPVNCAWAKWSQWGSCSTSCGGGTQVRQRGEDPVKECGGNSCVGSPNDQRVCNTQCCPVDCVWNKWSDWDACTTTCGGGTQKRKRAISIPSFCGGNQCLGDKLEFQDCNSQCCPVDCKWGPWEEWEVCSKTCEKGTQTRSREIAIEAFCAGNQCPGTYDDTRFCNDVCCPVHCQWGEWSRWSACTKTCETGTQYRDRVVNVDAVCNGEKCKGQTRKEQQCNTQCCPVDCVLTTWTHWTECSHTCGAKGSQNRHRNITQESFCGGKLCEMNRFETGECNKFCFNNGSLETDTCLCPAGWKGDCCQEDENECEYVNCTQNSKCFNTVGSFECICDHGYTKSEEKCLDIDECHLQLHDCHKMAQCINLEGKYTCKCDPGFSGNGITCIDVDECALESIYDSSGDDSGFYSGAYNLEYYSSSPLCHDEATCLNTYGGYNCQCNQGYVGDGVYCQDLDECKILEAAQRFVNSKYVDASFVQNEGNHTLVPCDIHATCSNMPGTYSCWCEEGYFGDGLLCKEINECDSDPCKNGGTCEDKVNAFSCTCPTGYAGTRCEMDKDECLFHSFQRSIESSGEEEASGLYVGQGNASICHDRATCTNTFGSYFCTCDRGFVGDGSSCIDLDECAIDADVEASSGREDVSGFSSGIKESTLLSFQPCGNHADCNNSIGDYSCTCKEGYRGDGFTCVEIDECFSNPCKNGGTCTDYVNGFQCQCRRGYTGANCETDIHECKEKTHSCDPKNARCINTDGSHECVCKYGYSGDGKTCFDLDECKIGLDDCNEETQLCRNRDGGFQCVCKDGYEMKDGDCKDIHECKEKTHLCDPKNARCINTDGSHECVCKYGYTGDGTTCFDLDECKLGLDDCNEETQLCRNQDGRFLCVCKDGYEIKDGECKDTDECSSGIHDCTGPHQECQNKLGSYECRCKSPLIMKNGKCDEHSRDENSQVVLADDPSRKPDEQTESSLLHIVLKPAILASAILTVLLLVAVVVLVVKLYQRRTNAEVSPISNGAYRRKSFGSDEVTEVDTVL